MSGLSTEDMQRAADVFFERVPVVYEVEVDFSPGYRSGSVKAYGATKDDADEIAEFVRRVSKAVYVSEDISEGEGE